MSRTRTVGYVVVGATRLHRTVLLEKIGDDVHPCHWCDSPVSWNKTYPQDRDGLVVDHLDGDKFNNEPANLVPACNPCNAGRVARDRWDAFRANQTHCPSGHELDAANTYIYGKRRMCRECRRQQKRAWRARSAA